MIADNSHHLVAAAAQRHERTLRQAQSALDDAERTGDPLTVAALAAHAHVSRSWLYTQPEILARLRQLADRRPRAGTPLAAPAERASDASLHRRLEMAHQRNKLLQAEVLELRSQLARALGEGRRRRQHGPDRPQHSGTPVPAGQDMS